MLKSFSASNKNRIVQLALYLTGLALIAILVYSSGIQRVLDLISKIEIQWILLALLTSIVGRFFRGFLWRIYLKGLEIDITPLKSTAIVMGGDFLGSFLVSNLGALARPFLLLPQNEELQGTSPYTAAVIVEQLIALLVRTLILLAGSSYFIAVHSRWISVITPIFILIGVHILIIVIILSSLTYSKRMSNFVARFIKMIVPNRLLNRLYGFTKYARNCRKSIWIILSSKTTLAQGFSIQLILNTLITGLTFYSIFRALGAIVDLSLLLFLPSVAGSASILPLTPAGLGFVEGFGVLLFSTISVSSHIVLTAYILSRVMDRLTTSIVGGLITVRATSHLLVPKE